MTDGKRTSLSVLPDADLVAVVMSELTQGWYSEGDIPVHHRLCRTRRDDDGCDCYARRTRPARAALDVLAARLADYAHLRSEWDLGHDRGDHLVYESEWEAFDRWQRSERTGTLGGDGSHWDGCWRSHIDCAVARIEAAEARERTLRDALERVQGQQPAALAMIQSHGFVFDDIGREPGNWQHLAFTIYTDLCEVDSIARAALAETEAAPGGDTA